MTRLAQWIATPRKPQPLYIVDPVAFVIALVFGPILFTILTSWALFIPIFALVFGGPIYLLVGTPVMLVYLRRNRALPGKLALLALYAVLGLFAATAVAGLIAPRSINTDKIIPFLLPGLIFGPAWAVSFTLLYNRLRRAFYAQPLAY